MITLFWIYLFLACISILFIMLNPILYIISPKLRQPPANLIFIISLIEISNCYHLLLCIFNYNSGSQYQVFRYLIEILSFGTFDLRQNELKSYYCRANVSIYSILVVFQFDMQLMLALDFIIRMKIPFISLKIRSLIYLLFIFFANIFNLVSLTEDSIKFCKNDYFKGNIFDFLKNQIVIYEVLLFLYTTVGGVLAYYNLQTTKKQFSGEIYRIKKQYYLNYLFCLFAFNIIWVAPLISVYISFCEQIAVAILLSQGVVLGFIRLNEKYFRFRLIILFKQLICIATSRDKEIINKFENDELEQDDPTFVPLYLLVSRHQTQIIIKNILSAIKKCSNSYIEILDQSIVRKCSEIRRVNISISKENVSRSQELQEIFLDKTNPKSDIILKITEIAPQIFYEIRQRNGISKTIISYSLDIESNSNSIKQTSESIGKSGSFFFFSFDNKLVIKTLKKQEVTDLYDRMLVSYSSHIQQNPNTILAKIYGLYSVQIQGFNTIYIALMENTMESMKQFLNPDRIYDLKGSLYSRVTIQSSLIQKDINFLNSQDLFLLMNRNMRERFFQQLEQDINLLRNCGFMDYSLLIAIADKPKTKINLKKKFNAINWRFIQLKDKYYSFAIIDYLQYFTFKKQMEFKYKSIIRQSNIISCVEPEFYKSRFYSFCNQIIISLND